MNTCLVFTDLDGTLLDHDSYSFAPALPALEALAARGIPVIIASSKTAAEILPLQEALGIRYPFICENGAAVHLPTDESGWRCEAFVQDRGQVLAVLQALRDAEAYRFEGFADWGPRGIASRTGLDLAQAALAGERHYSEPMLWMDTEERKTAFLAQLRRAGLNAQQGGRFLTVAGSCNKADAMAWLKLYYRALGTPHCIALGDSPNDLELLNQADTAVVIQSAHASSLQVSGAGRVIRSQQPGPLGWHEVIMRLLQTHEFTNLEN